MSRSWLCALLVIAACDRGRARSDTAPPAVPVPPAPAPVAAPEPAPDPEPYRRPLTEGEVALLARVFGDGVDPSLVHVVRGKFFRFQDDWTYMTPGNDIFAPGDLFDEDFARDGIDPYTQAVFVHEVAHVWQYQNGLDLIAAGLITFKGTRGDYGKAYAYALDADRDLTEYGIEQQASILEDWFLVQAHGLAPAKLENPPPTAKARDALYREVLAAFLSDPTYARRIEPDELLRRHAAASGAE
jgi:hypothetical protein